MQYVELYKITTEILANTPPYVTSVFGSLFLPYIFVFIILRLKVPRKVQIKQYNSSYIKVCFAFWNHYLISNPYAETKHSKKRIETSQINVVHLKTLLNYVNYAVF
jgi:hypothetical protein